MYETASAARGGAPAPPRPVSNKHPAADSTVLIELAEAGTPPCCCARAPPSGDGAGPRPRQRGGPPGTGRRVDGPDFPTHRHAGLVVAKLRRQHRLPVGRQGPPPDTRKALFDARGRGVAEALARRRSKAPPARLRRAAKEHHRTYFHGYTALFRRARLAGRGDRRPPRDPVNACLSLAYALLHFEAVRMAHAAGLDPLLGFLPSPGLRPRQLACDLLEPLTRHR